MKKFVFIKIISLIAIILALSYSVFIYNVSNSDFINWLNTAMSTVISVLFALIIAMSLFYYQENLIKKDTKNKHNTVIERYLIELWKNLSNLKEPTKIHFIDKEKKEELNFYLFNIHKIIFEQAICSNVFDVEQTGFLLYMMGVIDYHDIVKEKFVNLSIRFDENSNSDKKSIRILHNNNKKSITELKEIIKSANKSFKFKELNKLIKKNT